MAIFASPNFIQPIMGMLGVTAGVWGWMYVKRLRHMRQYNIDPQSIHTPPKLAATFPAAVNYPADNLKNLFEMPVIFYVICLVSESLRVQGFILSGWLYHAAWGYVILRALHSLIQCSYNKVMHRFIVYLLSCLILWGMVIYIAMLVW